MNRKTLVAVSSIVNKFGGNLNLVQWVDGLPVIYGVPVKLARAWTTSVFRTAQ